MTFDPKAFENLEALKAKESREADEAQIDAKLAEEGLDLAGARDLMYGDLLARTPEEIEAAKIAEASEPDAEEELIAALEGEEVGEEINGSRKAKTLIGSQGNDNIQNVEQIESDIEQQEALEGGLFSPRIDSLVLQGKLGDITVEEVEILKTTLLSGNIEDVNAIPDTDLSADKKSIVIEYLTDSEKPENQEKYTENFVNDFGSELKDFQNVKGEFKSDLDQAAFDMISVRYITPLEGEVSVGERKLALNTACETALNVEIDEKQFNRENKTYKQICRDIRNDMIPLFKRFQAVKDLLAFSNVEQGKGGKKQETMHRKIGAEQKLTDAGRLEKFNQLLVLFKEQEEGSAKQIKIAQELEAIRLEVGISPGEANLIAGGELLDIVNDNISENSQESA